MLIKKHRYLRFPQTFLDYETNSKNSGNLNVKVRGRKGRAIDGDSTSSSDPGSTDVSMNESDIPLTYLKPRQPQDVTNLPPATSKNLRSKTTTWYRPNPTFEDFQNQAGPSSSPQRPISRPIQTTSTPLKTLQKGPAESPSVSISSSKSSISNVGLDETIFSRTNITERPLVRTPTPTQTPTTTRLRPNTGIQMTAGEPYQHIFESQLGTAASHPDNPLRQSFSKLIYGDVRRFSYDEVFRKNVHDRVLGLLDRDTQDLRNDYNNSNSWYERQQIQGQLQKIYDRYTNNPPVLPFGHRDDIIEWRQILTQRIGLYKQHMAYTDAELRAQIDNGKEISIYY